MTEDRLKNYAKIKAEHRQLQKRLEDLDDKLYNPPAQHMTGMPHAKQTSSGSSQERLADLKMDLSEIYLSEIHTLVAEEIAIEKAIDRLDPASRTLMRHRYIDGLSWEDICKSMNYSKRHLHRIRRKALEKIKKPGE